MKPDPAALEVAGRVATLAAIADAIRTELNPNPADITAVMGDIGKLLDASITGVDMPAKPAPVMDLSTLPRSNRQVFLGKFPGRAVFRNRAARRLRVANDALGLRIETDRTVQFEGEQAEHDRHVHFHMVEDTATGLLARLDAVEPLALVAR